MYECVKLNATYSKDDFLRDVLIALSKDDNAPIDILDSDFGEIKVDDVEFLHAKVDTVALYDYERGHDRYESYNAVVPVKHHGNIHFETQVKVRTITDWVYTSGKNESTELVIARNRDDAASELERDMASITTILNKSANAFEDCVSPYREVCEKAKRAICYQAKLQCNKSIKESNNKSFIKTRAEHYTTEAEISKLVGVIIPEYTIEYTYKGKKYTARGYASKDIPIKYSAPKREITASNGVTPYMKKKLSKKPFMFTALALLIIGFLCFAFNETTAYPSEFYTSGFVIMGLGAALAVVGYILCETLNSKVNKLNQQTENSRRHAIAMARIEKNNRLTAALKARGLSLVPSSATKGDAIDLPQNAKNS